MSHQALACILPPDLLRKLEREAAGDRRPPIASTIELDQSFRRRRAELAARQVARPVGARAARGAARGTPNRSIYDQEHSTEYIPGTLIRKEGQGQVDDVSVNQAYDGFGLTWKLFWDVFSRDSIDDQGMPIMGMVHYGDAYDNAFWDGAGHMFFGDGDGHLLVDTTRSLDVIGHELTHGVTQHEANLTYSNQSGAVNESMSDVFGSLVRQYHLNQSAAKADWLIGKDIVGPELAPALRSMKAPGTANQYDNQPADMEHFVRTTQDNGGVHTNSGIPNHAFYVTATTLGGKAWKAPGSIWYAALLDSKVTPKTTFARFATVTLRQAKALYGTTSKEAQAVQAGWDAVKVRVR
ncbi:MAG TPA: M4 family metallopeptidase [Dermatophilaceae bacterium]|nr:M4 family metallopeptidase [Dermatophilaceae bacterium]